MRQHRPLARAYSQYSVGGHWQTHLREALTLRWRNYHTSRMMQRKGAWIEQMEAKALHNLRPDASKEPELSPEQKRVVELAAAGHNIFYTGSAGCGKSTVLRAIKSRLEEQGSEVDVLAPTGRVALANGGVTTWSYAGWTPNSHKKTLEDLRKSNKFLRKRFRNTDTVIIDEISMVENLHFERLNEVMKAAHKRGSYRSCLPFGGSQVIVTGDFCQLPPVKPFRHCIDCGGDLRADEKEESYQCSTVDCNRAYDDSEKWAFRSEAWEECEFDHIHLETIHRQKDPAFIRLLEKCRLGLRFDSADIDLLTLHDTPDMSGAVKLYCTRDEVRRANDVEFRRLRTPAQGHQCLDLFSWNEHLHPYLERYGKTNSDGSLQALEDHSFERHLKLKEGMLVVLLTNIDLSRGLCNGAQGIIVGFERRHTSDLPSKSKSDDYDLPVYWTNQHTSLENAQIRKFAHNCKGSRGWPIVQFHNGTRCTIYPDCQTILLGNEAPYSVIARTQIPLAPAWALSVHKSQGMTLDRVVVNLSQAFEEGQMYVALSRARALENLKVEGNPAQLRHFRGNVQVLSFLKDKFGATMAHLG